MSTIAVIQPYFIPYLGYFQLFAAADTVVLFDCVQFPRRGWVHRNRLSTRESEARWLTLPLRRCPRDTRIGDLAFPTDADVQLAERMRPFPACTAPSEDAAPLAAACRAREPERPAIDHLEATLRAALDCLDLAPALRRASSLNLAPELRGQARVLAICEAVGAETYVNPSGGAELYDPEAFAERGVTLRFLAPYDASRLSVLEDLHRRGAPRARREARAFRLLTADAARAAAAS